MKEDKKQKYILVFLVILCIFYIIISSISITYLLHNNLSSKPSHSSASDSSPDSSDSTNPSTATSTATPTAPTATAPSCVNWTSSLFNFKRPFGITMSEWQNSE